PKAEQVKGPAHADGAVTILGAGGYWRQHVTRMSPLVSVASARGAGMELDEATRALTLRVKRNKITPGSSPPPPQGWWGTDFDDGAWDRTMGAFGTGYQEVGLVCRRGKFVVNDPAAVKRLTLELAYYGGVVAWLNGREIVRASIEAGKITHRTPGADYPVDAFIVASGERKGKALHHYYDRKLSQQFALRNRKAGPVDIPVKGLRKGINVLAIELHSSQYPAQCRKAGTGYFAAIGLQKLLLRAEAAEGAILQAVARPPGRQVWNVEITEELTQLDYGQGGEPLGPMRIAAVRNGTFSGQVVVGSTEQITALSAEMGKLARVGGGSIPPAAVKVRYGQLGQTMRQRGGSVYGGPTGQSLGVYFRRFDGLLDSPPATVVGGSARCSHFPLLQR
ncbi:hypothetical protein LCGC14_2873470, partial [marine sediment metagenome]